MNPVPESIRFPLNRAASPRWYCVHTRPQKEKQAAHYCATNVGVETYCPRLRQVRTIRRVKRLTISPLFPRYFFCRLDLAEAYRSVRFAPDVIDIVHLGTDPAIVSDQLIAELRSWAGDCVDIINLQPPLEAGDHVELVDGPFRGLPAVIVRTCDERDRIAILLSILHCGAQVTVSRSQLRKVN